MSCAVFTGIGVYAASTNKGGPWLVEATWITAVVLYIVAAFIAWNDEHEGKVRTEKNLDLLGGPYLNMQFSPTNGGPSGFVITNDGEVNAVRVQINDVRVGNRTAKFAELPSIRNTGQDYATFPSKVEHPSTEHPPTPNDLRYVFDGLGVGDEVEVTVNYLGSKQHT